MLFGGAPGPGKTEALLVYAIMRRTQIPGSVGLFLRRELRRLERTAIPRFLELTAGTGVRARLDQYTFYWPNGSRQEFGGLKDPGDEFAYQGAEYDDICWDELTEFEEHQYRYLGSRLRSTIPGVRPQMRAGSNPLGVGHEWVKARFRIGTHPPNTPFTQTVAVALPGGLTRTITKSFRYIPASVFDNPVLMEHNPQYVAQLYELPEPFRTAYLTINWDVVAGAFFQFDRAKVVVDALELPTNAELFSALDWGFRTPYCHLWVWPDWDGRLWVVDELYGWGGRPNVGSEETVPVVAAKIRAREEQAGWRIRYRVADPRIWAAEGHSGPTIGEEFARAGLRFRPADNDRVAGWLQVHQRLRHDGLRIHRRCEHLLRTLGSLPPDPHDPDDADTKAEDHAPDALRYACMSRPFVPPQPRPEAAPLSERERFEQALAAAEAARFAEGQRARRISGLEY